MPKIGEWGGEWLFPPSNFWDARALSKAAFEYGDFAKESELDRIYACRHMRRIISILV